MTRTTVNTCTRVNLVKGTGTPLDIMMIVVTGRKAMAVVAVVVAVAVAETLATGVGLPDLDDRVVAPRTRVGPIRSTILSMTAHRAVV